MRTTAWQPGQQTRHPVVKSSFDMTINTNTTTTQQGPQTMSYTTKLTEVNALLGIFLDIILRKNNTKMAR
jgi:hypothetical protein